MKDLLAKVGRFCENHVEKIVFLIAGLIAAWLFFTRVIFSPNVQLVDGRTFSPGQIDRYIQEQKVEALRLALAQTKGEQVQTPYESRLRGMIEPNDVVIAGVIARPLPAGFLGLFESPVSFIDVDMTGIKPAPVAPSRMRAGRKYRLPRVPAVTEVGVNHIRAAVYVPREPLSPEVTYDKAEVEPNDVDLVTVEAKFDAAQLYRGFQESFNGVDVQKEEWRDPCLADPIFAAVQLERQELLEDGSWGSWAEVPRSRVEPHRLLFRTIERVEDLPPGGLDVRLMQFDEKTITMALLQPEAYQVASAEEEWFPPSFYGKFKDLQRKVQMEERREEIEKDRKQDNRTDNRQATGRAGYAGSGRVARGRMGTGVGGDTMNYGRGGRGGRGTTMGDPMTPGGRGRNARRGGTGTDMMYDDMYGGAMGDPTGRRKPTIDEVYFEFGDVLLNYTMDPYKLEEPLLIWAFDDTTEPGATYRYRLRVGVFNPVAGTDQLLERDVDKKDQVILWSDYSKVTDVVPIPRMMYMFAKDVQNNTKTATVEVARYALGYWRTEDFDVKPGETIGKEVEPKPDKRKESRRLASSRITDPRGDIGMMGMPGYGMPGYGAAANPADQAVKPEKVDYATGNVLVDLVEVSDWGIAPNLRPRTYHDMLYTADGARIDHMPVSMTNWPRDLLDAYQHIQTEKRREPQPFRSFDSGGMRSRGRGGMDGYEGMDGYQDMLYEMGPY